jgi:glyoxylase-like metal-dependent hydrolase (beta-lactamase superfamily II)/rhodanese-related sulfurtransferase
MKVVPFIHEGLGNSSYLVGLPNGEAALFDPDRTVARYLAAAEANGWRIAYVFETHLHADFVSGARELAETSGATLWAASEARLQFAYQPLVPGQAVQAGGTEVGVVGSPGHTPEHVAFTLRGPSGPPMLFSGGSLMVGGAARTDLIAPAQTEPLTRLQFRTLHTAFEALPDETLLYPTHGGGSFCSVGSGTARTSTLGLERRSNPVLEVRDEEEFVRWFPSTFPAVPDYFFRMRAVNQAGPLLRSEIVPPPSLLPGDFEQAMRSGALVVDTRPQAEFLASHIPGALSNTFRDAFATWLGWLVPPEVPLLFVTGEERIEDVVDECLLVGYERFAGVLADGIAAWTSSGRAVESARLVDAMAASRALAAGAVAIDVREDSEYDDSHISGALHIPLGSLAKRLPEVPRGRPLLTYCGHGERSATALSILQHAGFDQVINLDLGIGGWETAGEPLERMAAT